MIPFSTILGYGSFVFFELTVFVACWRFTGLLARPQRETALYELSLTAILGYIAFPSLYAHAMTAFQMNAVLTYMLPASLYWALVYLSAMRAKLTSVTLRDSTATNDFLHSMKTTGLFVFFLAAVFARLLDEIDSLGAVRDIYNWAANTQDPNISVFNYVTLWEMRYVPLVVLTGEIASAWAITLVPILGIFIGCVGVVSILQLPRTVILPYGLAAICLATYWVPGPSGVFTLKNDMAYNFAILAGTVVIALISVTGWTRLRAWWLALALGLVCIKYSGILIAACWLMGLAAVHIVYRLPQPRPLGPIVTPLIVLPLMTSGHHYVRNTVTYGNPFFPIEITVLGRTLVGTCRLDGTSIVDGIANPETWHLLFVSTGIHHPVGPWFVFACGLLVWWLPLMVWHAGLQAWQRSRTELPWVMIGVLTSLYWYTYVRSFWSASAQPGDNVYLQNLGSIRYASAAVLLTEMFALHVLWKALRSPTVVTVVSSAALAYRIMLLGRALPDQNTSLLVAILCHGVPVLGIVLTGCECIRRLGRGGVACAGVALLAAIALVTERSTTVHKGWADLWSPLTRKLYESEPHDVIQLVDSGGDRDSIQFDPLASFYARGRWQQHNFRTCGLADLDRSICDLHHSHVTVCYASRLPVPRTIVEQLLPEATNRRFTLVDWNDRAVVVSAIQSLPLFEASLSIDSTIPLVTGGGLPQPNEVSEVGPRREKRQLWHNGNCFAFGDPIEIFKIVQSDVVRVKCRPGDSFVLEDYGDLGPARSAARIFWDGEHWRLPIPMKAYMSSNAPPLAAVHVSAPDPDGVKTAHDPKTGEISLAMLRPMPWAIWAVPALQLPRDELITVRVRVKTNASTKCNMHWFDFHDNTIVRHAQVTASASEEWQVLDLVIRPNGSSSRDYIGIGLANASKHDQVTVASLQFLRGDWSVPGVQ